MSELEKECNKHPENFRDLTPEEFAREFGNTNYFYQEKCYEELQKEYKRQSEGDAKRQSLKNKSEKRIQLSSGLENLSTAFYLVVKSMKQICNSCKNYLKNPFEN